MAHDAATTPPTTPAPATPEDAGQAGRAAYSDAAIRAILDEVRTIAMVGASARDVRPSYFAMKYLLDKGYEVVPVNPGQAGGTILGRRVHASLADIPQPVDMVDIFRGSDAAPAIVAEALRLKPRPKVIWMQLGVVSEEAARLAAAAGLKVVMNRCPKIEYGRLSGEIAWAGVNTRTLTSKKPLLRPGHQHWGLRPKGGG